MYKESGLFSSQSGVSEHGSFFSGLHHVADGSAMVRVCERDCMLRFGKQMVGTGGGDGKCHKHLYQKITGLP